MGQMEDIGYMYLFETCLRRHDSDPVALYERDKRRERRGEEASSCMEDNGAPGTEQHDYRGSVSLPRRPIDQQKCIFRRRTGAVLFLFSLVFWGQLMPHVIGRTGIK
jgi:hypothetical protein